MMMDDAHNSIDLEIISLLIFEMRNDAELKPLSWTVVLLIFLLAAKKPNFTIKFIILAYNPKA